MRIGGGTVVTTLEQELQARRLHTIGQARKRDRELLALLALLNPADVSRVNSNWDRLAPKPWRGLTAALPSSPLSAPAARFWFDPARIRFGLGTQGLIPPTAVRHALNIYLHRAAAELAQLTIATGRGIVPVSTWQDAMTSSIKDVQLVNAAVGRGGSLAIQPGDLREISQYIEYQLGRLDRFAVQLEQEVDIPTPDAAGERAAHYADSAISTYDRMRRHAAEDAEMTLERNLLGNAEHCRPDPRRPHIPDCPSLSRKGWVPIGTLAPVGERICLWNCKCHIDYES
jgi:hypothetical protein